MNTKIIGVVVAGVVVVVGGYWYFTTPKVSAPSGSVSGTTASQSSNAPLSGSGTFADLMSRGGSYQCDISMTDKGISSKGTVYIADKDIRADFASVTAGQNITSSMINAGGYIYTWTDLYPQGFKMPVAPSTAPSSGASQGGFNTTANVIYDCKAWSVDQSKFTPPTSVKFTTAPGK